MLASVLVWFWEYLKVDMWPEIVLSSNIYIQLIVKQNNNIPTEIQSSYNHMAQSLNTRFSSYSNYDLCKVENNISWMLISYSSRLRKNLIIILYFCSHSSNHDFDSSVTVTCLPLRLQVPSYFGSVRVITARCELSFVWYTVPHFPTSCKLFLNYYVTTDVQI